MTLAQLEEIVARMRARGVHRMTPVVVKDVDGSFMDLHSADNFNGKVVLHPGWIEVEDEEP